MLSVGVVSPHGGLAIPPELEGRIALTPEQIFNEADAYVDDIYNFGDEVLYFETFPYARAIIDVNRSPEMGDNRPGDGVVKLQTSYGAPVYYEGAEPDAALRRLLLERYWEPWQARMRIVTQDERVKFVLDAHTMAAVGPSKYDDPAAVRPFFSVANFGDSFGQPAPQLRAPTSSVALIQAFAALLAKNGRDLSPLVPIGEMVRLNHPFVGGWNIYQYGGYQQPWLMVEVNRGLYIGSQSGDSAIVALDEARVKLIRAALRQTLTAIMEEYLEAAYV